MLEAPTYSGPVYGMEPNCIIFHSCGCHTTCHNHNPPPSQVSTGIIAFGGAVVGGIVVIAAPITPLPLPISDIFEAHE